ncbi:MAG: hypothetical protein DWQ02_11415, partial [Bacteroidetes bacterium]
EEERDVIFFPIRQMECHLKKRGNSPIDDDILEIKDYCYFPSWYFVDFTEVWECNNTIDYLFEVQSSRRSAEWLALQLKDLNEPCLYNQKTEEDSIFRFTWLRSFHHPISVRIEKKNEKILLYGKIGNGAGGYEPEGLKRSKKRRVIKRDWDKFLTLLNEANFNDLPHQEYVPMTDGASWTLERKNSEGFKAFRTNDPDDALMESCLFLLKLSGIRIKQEDIY